MPTTKTTRTCRDCSEEFPRDDTGLSWCPDCRPFHPVKCRTCNAPIDASTTDRLCACCRDQKPLF